MKFISFGRDPEARAVLMGADSVAAPPAATSRPSAPAWSKALTGAIVAGGVMLAFRSAAQPIRGGIEVTSVRR